MPSRHSQYQIRNVVLYISKISKIEACRKYFTVRYVWVDLATAQNNCGFRVETDHADGSSGPRAGPPGTIPCACWELADPGTTTPYIRTIVSFQPWSIFQEEYLAVKV